jgi:uncharacterized protein YfbU (UPF0304 family)/plasmid stability protein
MATITIRLDDEIRDALIVRAEEGSLTVSDFVRDLIREAVVDVADPRNLDGYIPETLSPKERHTLALLHRILARVLPEDENDVDGDKAYQLDRAKVLEEGFTQEYWTEFAGIENELSKRDSQRVMDILDLFRIAGDSITRHRADGTVVSDGLAEAFRFEGFDFNDILEGKMAAYMRYLVEDGRWEEQAGFVNGPTSGNSHARLLDMYLRMLAEYRRVRSRRRPTLGGRDHMLTLGELEAIAAERVHPDNR